MKAKIVVLLQTLYYLLLFSTSTTFPPPVAAQDDDYDYTPTPPPPPPAPCNPDDKNTLLRIKQSLNNSTLLSSWNPNFDCCSGWDFVACDASTGRVITLSFYGIGWGSGRDDLPAAFPSAIGDLTYLESLVFYNNATGPIPDSIKNLQHLKFLYLDRNRLTGPIPSFLSTFQNLSFLHLNNNQLTGLIPSSLAEAPSLYVIQLDNNKLTGRIPKSLGHLRNINNNVVTLTLSNNRLHGRIPRSFGDVDFRHLNLGGNKLMGDASFLFGKDKNIWILDLSRNELSFNMSKVEMPPQLSWLELSHNQIYGSLTNDLINLRLDYFNVSYNRLCGPIPVGGQLQKFNETAYFHNKCLCGSPLPPCH